MQAPGAPDTQRRLSKVRAEDRQASGGCPPPPRSLMDRLRAPRTPPRPTRPCASSGCCHQEPCGSTRWLRTRCPNTRCCHQATGLGRRSRKPASSTSTSSNLAPERLASYRLDAGPRPCWFPAKIMGVQRPSASATVEPRARAQPCRLRLEPDPDVAARDGSRRSGCRGSCVASRNPEPWMMPPEVVQGLKEKHTRNKWSRVRRTPRGSLHSDRVGRAPTS